MNSASAFAAARAEPFYDARYALYVVVLRYYERYQRLERLLIEHAYPVRLRETAGQPRVGRDRPLYRAVIAPEVEVMRPHGGGGGGGAHDPHRAVLPYEQRRLAADDAEHAAAEWPPAERLTAGAALADVEAVDAAKQYRIVLKRNVHTMIVAFCRKQSSVNGRKAKIYRFFLKKCLTRAARGANIGR